MGSQDFLPFLVSISEQIKTQECELLTFLCEIPNGKLSEIKTPIDLFKILIERGQLSRHDTSFLVKVLKDAKLDALSVQVEEYSAQGRFNRSSQNRLF